MKKHFKEHWRFYLWTLISALIGLTLNEQFQNWIGEHGVIIASVCVIAFCAFILWDVYNNPGS